jgi:membrane-associated HD superfamily phosphohydrolase
LPAFLLPFKQTAIDQKSPGWNFLCIFVSNTAAMKQGLLVSLLIIFFSFYISQPVKAQCSICTKTAQQLGEQPAKGLNSGILYLAFMPMAIVGIIGYRWWRSNRQA